MGAIFGIIASLVSARIIGSLLSGDEAAGMLVLVLGLYGLPIALVAGGIIGVRGFGYRDRGVLAATGGGLAGMIAVFIIALPISLVSGDGLDRLPVARLLDYGLPIAIVVGAVQGRRRFGQAPDSTPSE